MNTDDTGQHAGGESAPGGEQHPNIPHNLAMLAFNMPVQVRPSKTRRIAILIRAVIAQQKHGILEDIDCLVLDAQGVVCPHKVRVVEVLVSLGAIVCEYHEIRFGLFMG